MNSFFRSSAATAFLARALTSVRARLIALALLIIVPLMFDRVSVLEHSRTQKIEQLRNEVSSLAQEGAERQSEVIANVGSFIEATTKFYAAMTRRGASCDDFLSNVTFASWTKNVAIADRDGRVLCSSERTVLGVNIDDRNYFRDARDRNRFSMSNYIVARGTNEPVIIVAQPVHFTKADAVDQVLIMSVNLHWLTNMKNDVGDIAMANTLLIDSRGRVLAGSGVNAQFVGSAQIDHPLVQAIMAKRSGIVTMDGLDKSRQIVGYTHIPGTQSVLAVGMDETAMLRQIDTRIRNTYMQFGLYAALALIIGWFGGEFMIVRPLHAFASVAARLGKGDFRTRAPMKNIAAEFEPLAQAFNSMAEQLADRDQSLRAANNRLTVLAMIDTVSGLSNRRAFESRMEFEWLRASEESQSLGLIMVDVDYFKLYNDTYGHPEGDACLRRVGDMLADIANRTRGFVARYGGEEFVLLVPGADQMHALEVGEMIRNEIAERNIPHRASPLKHVSVSVGVAAMQPSALEQPDILIEAADAGLYLAKGRGRNQVVAHGLITPVEGEAGPALAAMARRDQVAEA